MLCRAVADPLSRGSATRKPLIFSSRSLGFARANPRRDTTPEAGRLRGPGRSPAAAAGGSHERTPCSPTDSPVEADILGGVAVPGARLRVRVSPGARSSALVGRHGDAWRVRVNAPPERGRANAAVLGVLADALGVRRSELRLVAGGAGKDKLVEVEGITLGEAERRLTAAGTAAR
jgi:uncharacterized protein